MWSSVDPCRQEPSCEQSFTILRLNEFRTPGVVEYKIRREYRVFLHSKSVLTEGLCHPGGQADGQEAGQGVHKPD